MSASSLFSLGTKALTASYAALATTGHNISNANVKGYSRQQVELTTAVGQASGAGYFGKGVDVTTVTRAYDSFLTRESATANSLAAMDQSRLTLLNQLESVFPTGEQGVGYAAGQFLNSMVDLSARPSDAATRQVVLARAAEVANRFAAAGSQLDQLQLAVQEDLKADVARINQLAAGIAELNQRIVTAQGVGHAPNDLLDQRDQALADLSEKLQISTVPADDGSVTVFVTGGQTLVMGNRANTMSVIADTSDASRSALGLTDNGFVRRLQSQELGGGEVAGLLRFQNDDLVDARTLIGQMAAALAGAVNQQQALGLDLRDPPGSGMPLFATGAAQALPDAANASLNRRMAHARDVLKGSNSEKPVVDALFRVSPQVLFVLMPIFALMLKLAYAFKRRLYMEHLLVALHSHSFISLALTVVIVVVGLQAWLAPNPGF